MSPNLKLAFEIQAVIFVFQDRVSLCNSSGCPGTHSVDQAGLQLTEINLLCAVLELKVCATTSWLSVCS